MTRRAVINLADARPVWAPDRATLDAIAGAFPADWTVITVAEPADGRGDGGDVTPAVIEAVRGAEVYIGFGAPPALLEAAGTGLKWVHTGAAGVGSLLHDTMRASDVVLTNSAGIHAAPMADTVLAMVLYFARGLDHATRAQHERRWDTTPFHQATGGSIFELEGSTLGVIGLGSIGVEVARRARTLGMSVIATRRSDRPASEGIELLRGADALHRLMGAADIVVITTPSTPETRGMIGRDALQHMRSNAVLLNVARGDVLDEEALIELLRDGRIRGAGLDVLRQEPLPPDSPLWTLPNVLITPHVSATTLRFWPRQRELILDNIARYLAGRPLRNVVDKRAGY